MNNTPFKAGGHEKKLRRYFGKNFHIPADTTPVTAPLNIMVFVNRSGSSMIAEYLRATRAFSGFGEPLNYETVIERSKNAGIDSFKGYLDWLIENVYRSGTQFGIKASPDQVLMLLRSGAIPHYFSNVRWIFVQRLDVLSQAISFCIANQTKQWHSFQAANETEPVYNFDDILQRVTFIGSAYAESISLMAAYGITPYHLTYEQFLQNPVEETRKISAHLGAENVSIDTSGLKIKKQAGQTNADFKARFIAEFSNSQSTHS